MHSLRVARHDAPVCQGIARYGFLLILKNHYDDSVTRHNSYVALVAIHQLCTSAICMMLRKHAVYPSLGINHSTMLVNRTQADTVQNTSDHWATTGRYCRFYE